MLGTSWDSKALHSVVSGKAFTRPCRPLCRSYKYVYGASFMYVLAIDGGMPRVLLFHGLGV